jgi:acetyl-CoA carboxylase carboxyl transferase subunit alpha
MNGSSLDFEKPVLDLEVQLEELNLLVRENRASGDSVRKLRKKLQKVRRDTFADLSPWQRTLLARHPDRPYFLDLAGHIFEEATEIHGDRSFRDDPSIVTLLARFEGQSVFAIGHQKGRNVKDNIHRNFGMPHPEGYRKALRVMKMAEKFGKPVLTFIDTPGAHPGIGAEERGQSEAIARNLYEMSRLRVPVIATVIGEGGSGGALAIGVADRVLMLENAVYSVISPEACAAILWRDDRSRAPEAADALRLTAQYALRHKLIDEVVREPIGGIHRKPVSGANILRRVIRRHLGELVSMDGEERVEARCRKFRNMGEFAEENLPEEKLAEEKPPEEKPPEENLPAEAAPPEE